MPNPRALEDKMAPRTHPAPTALRPIITRRASDIPRAGSLWVYRSALSPTAHSRYRNWLAAAPGEIVTVLDNRGIHDGTPAPLL